ncbi:MAG TPA: TA system VapC family ribonuclease toxin [Polyangia bacterium]|nr:TA system VapC family ribonuclease toxin [Polyangia bacterium]
MIAVDTNILVYAHRRESPFHAAAAACVRGLAEGDASWAIPWPCLHEFLAITTSAKIFKHATPIAIALAQVDHWRESPSLKLIGEDEGYWGPFAELVRSGEIRGAKVHDARIAAIALTHGVRELLSADRDFSRMAPLSVRNPLRN